MVNPRHKASAHMARYKQEQEKFLHTFNLGVALSQMFHGSLDPWMWDVNMRSHTVLVLWAGSPFAAQALMIACDFQVLAT